MTRMATIKSKEELFTNNTNNPDRERARQARIAFANLCAAKGILKCTDLSCQASRSRTHTSCKVVNINGKEWDNRWFNLALRCVEGCELLPLVGGPDPLFVESDGSNRNTAVPAAFKTIAQSCGLLCCWNPLCFLDGGPYEMDHINGDRTNDTTRNLRILCVRCHACTPTHPHSRPKKKRRSPEPSRPSKIVKPQQADHASKVNAVDAERAAHKAEVQRFEAEIRQLKQSAAAEREPKRESSTVKKTSIAKTESQKSPAKQEVDVRCPCGSKCNAEGQRPNIRDAYHDHMQGQVEGLNMRQIRRRTLQLRKHGLIPPKGPAQSVAERSMKYRQRKLEREH